jgi:hypothetical protein
MREGLSLYTVIDQFGALHMVPKRTGLICCLPRSRAVWRFSRAVMLPGLCTRVDASLMVNISKRWEVVMVGGVGLWWFLIRQQKALQRIIFAGLWSSEAVPEEAREPAAVRCRSPRQYHYRF